MYKLPRRAWEREKRHHDVSAGLGADVALGWPKGSGSVSYGTAGESATGSGIVGGGVGISVGVEACYTYIY